MAAAAGNSAPSNDLCCMIRPRDFGKVRAAARGCQVPKVALPKFAPKAAVGSTDSVFYTRRLGRWLCLIAVYQFREVARKAGGGFAILWAQEGSRRAGQRAERNGDRRARQQRGLCDMPDAALARRRADTMQAQLPQVPHGPLPAWPKQITSGLATKASPFYAPSHTPRQPSCCGLASWGAAA